MNCMGEDGVPWGYVLDSHLSMVRISIGLEECLVSYALEGVVCCYEGIQVRLWLIDAFI